MLNNTCDIDGLCMDLVRLHARSNDEEMRDTEAMDMITDYAHYNGGRGGYITTLLHVACSRFSLRVVQHTLRTLKYRDCGFSPHTLSPPLASCFFSSKSETCCESICRFLVTAGANPFHKLENGELTIHFACKSGRLRSSKFLLQKMLEMTQPDNPHGPYTAATIAQLNDSLTKNTLLHSACSGRALAVIKWLLSEECSFLWPDGSACEYVLQGSGYDKANALTCLASGNTRISVEAFDHVYGFIKCKGPEVCSEVLRKCLLLASINSDKRRAKDPDVISHDIAFIRYIFSALSELGPTVRMDGPLLSYVVGWFGKSDRNWQHSGHKRDVGISFAEAKAVADLVRECICTFGYSEEAVRQVIRHQSQYHPKLGKECHGFASLISVHILLGWYPHTYDNARDVLNQDFAPRVVAHYLSHTGDELLDEAEFSELLLLALERDIEEVVLVLVDVMNRKGMTNQVCARLVPRIHARSQQGSGFNVNTTRFMFWALEKKRNAQATEADPVSGDYTLNPPSSSGPDRISTEHARSLLSIFDKANRSAAAAVVHSSASPYSTPAYPLKSCWIVRHLVSAHGFDGYMFLKLPKILYLSSACMSSIIWHTDITPTQFLASIDQRRVLLDMGSAEIRRQIARIYSLRCALRERGQGGGGKKRIVMGPRTHPHEHRSPFPLPYRATDLILSMLWEGPELDMGPFRVDG